MMSSEFETRDLIASMAMMGMIMSGHYSLRIIPQEAYELADEMIIEKDKHDGND